MSLARKLATLAIGAGVAIVYAPAIRAQSAAAAPKWEVASIKPCASGSAPGGPAATPGRLTLNCVSVGAMINQSYVMYANGRLTLPGGRFVPLERGPAWIYSGLYRIEAKAEGTPSQEMMLGPMMQALLEDRFKLKIHSETREIPVYVLTVAKSGPRLQASREGSCRPLDLLHPPAPPPPGQSLLQACKLARVTHDEYDIRGVTMAEFGRQLGLGREVIDKTGIQGVFDIRVPAPGLAGLFFTAPPSPPGAGRAGPAEPASQPDPGDLFAAMQTIVQKLGLKLEPAKGPGRFLVIDHVEKPSAN